MDGPVAVALPGKRVYVLPDDKAAHEFADFLVAEGEPEAQVLPLADPVVAVLAWRRVLEELPDPGASVQGHADRVADAVYPQTVRAELLDAAVEGLAPPADPPAGAVHVAISDACQQGRHLACAGEGCGCKRHGDQLAPCAGSLSRIAQRRPWPRGRPGR